MTKSVHFLLVIMLNIMLLGFLVIISGFCVYFSQHFLMDSEHVSFHNSIISVVLCVYVSIAPFGIQCLVCVLCVHVLEEQL